MKEIILKIKSVLKKIVLKDRIQFQKKRYYEEHIKNSVSILMAAVGLIFLWPIMVLIGIAIKVNDGGSVFFSQERLGKNLKPFQIYKFRTMIYNPKPNQAQSLLSEEDQRITRIGRILRKTSLDELPQLFNILKGNMSVIGPRPIMVEEFAPYTNSPIAKSRFKVKPGLFCSVDIVYRAVATRDLQFKMDAEYVKNITFLRDIGIFIRVLITVISRKNIYSIPLKEEQDMYYTPSSEEKGDSNS